MEAAVPTKGSAGRALSWFEKWDLMSPIERAAAEARGRAFKRLMQEAYDYSPFKMEKIAETVKRTGGKAEELIKSRMK